jgi:quinoprotein glucose dehydrogenase
MKPKLAIATVAVLLVAGPSSLRAQPPATPAEAGSAAPPQATWDSFHGQLNAQKYSPLTQITAANVQHLRKVWEFHTGDVSDGSGKVPATVWSATPIFANDTIYIGTPFYRLIALDPATGRPKWSFDTHTPLKATTQPVLKNRGVA